MSMPERGKARPLSRPRRWIGDLMYLVRDTPLITFQRRMDLAALAQARRVLSQPPAWPLLFMKAFSRVALERPHLRRIYRSFPYERLYEHPISIAMMAIERDYEGEPAVFFAPFRAPDQQSLPNLASHLQKYTTAPVDKVGAFRQLIQISAFPRPIRRLVWWCGTGLSSHRRVRRLGTFGLSVTASLGATALELRSPTSTTLHYGMFQTNHQLDVYLTFDHRVMDGAPVARAMTHLEEELNTTILSELRAMEPLRRSVG